MRETERQTDGQIDTEVKEREYPGSKRPISGPVSE